MRIFKVYKKNLLILNDYIFYCIYNVKNLIIDLYAIENANCKYF